MTDVVNLSKKAFTWSVVLMTVVWSMGAAALMPLVANAAEECPTFEAGMLIQVENDADRAVWLVNSELERMYFPTAKEYRTWFGDDFSSVVKVSGACAGQLEAGQGVTFRPGSRLFKLKAFPNVYASLPGNKKALIPDGDTAVKLYGENWGTLIADVPAVFDNNYTLVDPLEGFHNGQLLQVEGSTDVWYLMDGVLHMIDGDLPQHVAVDIRAVSEADVADVAKSESTVTAGSITADPAQGAGMSDGGNGETPTPAGDLSVSLAADSPGAGTVPVGSQVDLLKLRFSGDANVTALTVTRSALSNEDDLDDVGVYVNGVRQGNLKDSWNNDNQMTFNFLNEIEVNSGNPVDVMIKGRVAASNGSYVGVQISEAADIITDSDVSGSFPLSGSLMSIAGGVTAGALFVDGVTNHDNASAEFGQDDVILAEFDLNAKVNGAVNSDEDVLWTAITFENGGTADDSAVNNLRLFVDGEEVSLTNAPMLSGDMITFEFNPVTIEKGDSVNVELKGDLVSGETNDTLIFFIKAITATGKQLGYSAAANIDNLDRKTDANATTVTLTAGDITMNMDKSSDTGTPSKDVRPDTDNVVLATIELTSNDEVVEITSIDSAEANDRFIVSGVTADSLTGFELRQVGGGTYDVTAVYDAAEDNYNLSVSDEIQLPQGEKVVFHLIADVGSTSVSGDSWSVSLSADAFTEEGLTSGSTTLDFTPNTVQSATIDIENASLEITNLAQTNLTVVPGAEGQIIYRGRVEAGDASPVRLTSLKLDSYDADGNNEDSLFSDTNISQLRLYTKTEGGEWTMVKSSSNAITEGLDAGTGTVTFSSLPSATVVPAGEQVEVKVEADFTPNSFSGAGEFALRIATVGDVVAKTAEGSVETLTAGQKSFVGASQTVESRQVTLSSVGTLAVDLQTDSANWNRSMYLLAGGTTPDGRYAAELVFSAENEDIIVEEIQFATSTNSTATANDIESVELVNFAGEVVASATYGAPTTTFSNLNLVIEKEASTSYFLRPVAKGINVANDAGSTATAGRLLKLEVASVTAKGFDTKTDLTIAAAGDGSPAANEYDDTDQSVTSTVMAVRLNSISNAMTDGTLTGGNGRTIGKYTVAFDNGENRDANNGAYEASLTELILTIASSSAVDIANVQVYLEGDSGTKTVAANPAANVVTVDLSTLDSVSGTATFVVIADVTTTAADGEYLQTEIDDLSTDFTWSGGAANGGDSRLKISEVLGGVLSE